MADATLTLVSDALDEPVLVQHLHGYESLSGLFEFEIQFEVDAHLDEDALTKLAKGPVVVGFAGQEHARPWSGILKSIQQHPGAGDQAVYRARLVPPLWVMSQTTRSRVFQDLGPKEIIAQALKEAGFVEDTHFKFHLIEKYPKLEYTVQYEETDYNFIARLMKHYGMFYFLRSDDDGEKLIIADENGVFEPLETFESIPYDDRGAGVSVSLRDGSRTCAIVQQHWVVRDYNWLTPASALQGDEKIDKDGIGMSVVHGDHFKDGKEGRQIAKVRAERALLPKYRFNARGSVYGLRAGHKFTLEGQPDAWSDFSGDYYITGIHHSVDQTGGEGRGYDSHIEFTPIEYAYRSEEKVVKPQVTALITGKIDGQIVNVATPIDDKGRYRVQLPFDTVGVKGGRASCWIRMAQPASGPGYGVHFPLHIGTEVLIGHINGDPDRPVIVGSVPNANTMSPVVNANATQSAIRTKGDILIEFEDDA
jgi:type VI secretion system secreted protein VgrG